MSERKVLNKYYPPDFDPSKIPKLREPRNKTFSIRIMAPFNMRCNVCGEYIYKGKKFNSRKENVDDEDFLGLRIFRFYIRCPKCVAEIAFKTDLKNTDYTLEAGATRLFEAEKLAQQMAEEERREKEAEELNPMKVLENRTKASHKEMAQIDELEELREINARHAKVDTNVLLEKRRFYEEHLERLQKEEEDRIVESIFGKKEGHVVKRVAESSSDDEDVRKPEAKKPALVVGQSATDILVSQSTLEAGQSAKPEVKKAEPWMKTAGKFATKSSLASLVKKKQQSNNSKPEASNASATSTSFSPDRGVADSIPREGVAVKDSGSSLDTDWKQATVRSGQAQEAGKPTTVNSLSKNVASAPKTGSALNLLGGYSDSEDSASS